MPAPPHHSATSPPLVVMMGVSGSGKTTVGAALAQLLGVSFADADDFHPAANITKMAAGVPLDDDDRRPWLRTIATWLESHTHAGGVVACSALKRSYRDTLRAGEARPVFVHLDGRPAVVTARMASRLGHFMPVALVESQFAALEPLESDEHGVVLPLDQPVDDLVSAAFDALATLASTASTPTTTGARA